MHTILASAVTIILTLFATSVFAEETGPVGGVFCPKLTSSFQITARDSSTGGQVTRLQHFLSDYYDVNPDDMITGYFGNNTRKYVRKFQCETGIACSGNESTTGYGRVGAMTRAAIATRCGDAPSQCIPLQPETRTSTQCPVGQTGTITERRVSLCAIGSTAPTWGVWTTISNTCATSNNLSCTFNGQTIIHGTSVTAWQVANATAAVSCVSQQRTCANGNLSGTYQYVTCSPFAGTTPPFVWHHIGGSTNTYAVVGVYDLDKNGTSDVLFRGPEGDIGYYSINPNDTFTWRTIGGSNNTYKVVGIGDFTRSGKPQIMFRGPDGDMGYYQLNTDGTFVWHHIGSSNNTYSVVAIGDFDHSGASEVLFQGPSGDLGYYSINADDTFKWHVIAGSNNTYKVVGVGDFTRSGGTQIMFRGPNGDMGYYELNTDGTFKKWHSIGGSTNTYSVVGIGDFNRSGNSQVLFRGPDGDLGYYQINSDDTFTWRHLGGSTNTYSVVGVGDFSKSGSSQIMFRGPDGDMGYYQLSL